MAKCDAWGGWLFCTWDMENEIARKGIDFPIWRLKKKRNFFIFWFRRGLRTLSVLAIFPGQRGRLFIRHRVPDLLPRLLRERRVRGHQAEQQQEEEGQEQRGMLKTHQFPRNKRKVFLKKCSPTQTVSGKGRTTITTKLTFLAPETAEHPSPPLPAAAGPEGRRVR